MNQFKLGKRPPTRDARDARFENFRSSLAAAGKLPSVPPTFASEDDFPGEAWLMLGNGPDSSIPAKWTAAKEGCGDCAWAGPAHETMELDKKATRTVAPFNAETVIKQYSEYSGYDPVTGANDNGSEVRDVLKWRQEKGLRDAGGTPHKIGPYVSLEPKNIEHLLLAAYLFENVGIGIEVPDSAQRQFSEGQPWSVVQGAKIEGGHYVPVVGRPQSGVIAFVTWAQRAMMTDSFYTTYNDEAWAYVSAEQFTAVTGKDYEGYNEAQLEEYLQLSAEAKAS
jgi:hypothetical protein